ncbi:MAG: flagellar hook capping FlgD N-terminal domain-containing protein [Janthinobacterium lividum]
MSVLPIQSSPYSTQTATPVGVKSADATTSAAASTGSNVSDLSNTFLQLLTQELQNQDPTAPMDSTQMVGQMISLNQLEQLSSINQKLTPSTDASATTGTATGKAVTDAQMASTSATAAAHAAFQAASMGSGFGGTLSVPVNTGVSGL